MAATILIVEDEYAVARGIQYALQQEGYEVALARSGEEGLEVATRSAPDLVLLDVRLPGMDGFEVLRRLRATGAKSPVLMLTARDEEVDKVIGLELGADDYLTKPYGTRELIARIRTQLRRARLTAPVPRAPVTGSVIRVGPIDVLVEGREVRVAGRSITLTRTEFDILAFLAQHAGAALTREQIIAAVWGYDAAESVDGDRLVDSHIKNLRRKLGGPWIQTMPRVGYKLSA